MIEENVLNLTSGWKRTKEKYALNNDQSLRNLDNLISPCGETVSLFVVEEEVETGLRMFDKMFRDYKNITTNLVLTYVGRFKIKKNQIVAYLIKDKDRERFIMHLLFEIKNQLYALIFNIEKPSSNYKELISNNAVLRETIKLLEVQF